MHPGERPGVSAYIRDYFLNLSVQLYEFMFLGRVPFEDRRLAHAEGESMIRFTCDEVEGGGHTFS